MMGVFFSVSFVRPLQKNHSRSRLIGPPIDPVMSREVMRSSVAGLTPAAASARDR